MMNATVIDSNTMVCDSPPLESVNGDLFYNMSVTLDGTFRSNATGVFKYYEQPDISSVSPSLGPISGNTKTEIHGKGFNQTNICDLKVRFGRKHVVPHDYTNTKLSATAPEA